MRQHVNRLLRALDPVDFSLMHPHFREVRLSAGSLLQQQEAAVDRIYFPISTVVSLLTRMENGITVETAIIGREGAVGAFAGLGPWRAFSHAKVQVPGVAVAIDAESFQRAVSESEPVRNLILRYKESLLGQVQQTAACNALHPLEHRLARWLLQILDRVDDPQLPLTQEAISQMLGVRRTSVTLLARKLQADGLIHYRRGKIAVRDRVGLEEVACECYLTIRRRTEAALNCIAGTESPQEEAMPTGYGAA